ncbi:MAG: hypothetical protein K2O96_02025 [Lachnospiraceae bacterium]|nr:hypothetical protein [Lachnospiraceae bacterium]
MDKFLKRLLGIAAIGAAVAGVVYYLKQNQASDEEFEDDFEDEDFDLDNDLKPVGDREYVSLTPKEEASDDSCEETEDKEENSEEA